MSERTSVRSLVRHLSIGCIILVPSLFLLDWGSVAAQDMPNSAFHAAGEWHFTLTYAKTHAKSSWEAAIKQDSRGNLKGHVEPSSIDCSAQLTGSVHTRSVKMNWRVKSPCSTENIALAGNASHHRMGGTFRDSRMGSGVFSGTQDS
jgi:hypothetical protein